MKSDVTIHCNADMLNEALGLLSDLAKRSTEAVQLFLNGLDDRSQLVRVDSDGFGALGASHTLIVFHPSDLLVEFLLAYGAGECDDH